MKDEIRQPTPPNPDSEAESRASPDTEQLASQMSALLADLVRTPAPDLDELAHVLRPGDRLGRFTLVRQLGRGGMGVVWEAEDPDLSRRVAVKVVRPGAQAKVRTREWLQREAEAVARLSHPNIVTLFDFGVAASGPFLVFELLQGEPLDRRLRGGPLPFASALRIGVEACRALVHAHRAGVVHRDLKPGNVFVSDAGDVKILDFGLASLLGRTGPAEGGTPAFMAPEQWRGELGDERADLFALGVTLWSALTGEVPYPVKDGRSAVEQPGPAPRLPAAAAPARFRRLVERCVERDPAARPASAKALLDALRALERSHAGRGRRRLLGLVTAAGLAAAAVAGWLWWSREPPPGERLTVLVADADNRAGEPALDGLGRLLSASLEQSRRLVVLPRARLAGLAVKAGLPAPARLDAAAARDLGRLANADLLLLPSVRREGAGLLVELRAVDPASGTTRFTLAESADGVSGVPAVLDRLGDGARRRLQERAEELRAGRIQVARAFSPSLEATRAYFDGLDCLAAAHLGAAESHCRGSFERAVALDPTFALAHFELAKVEAPWGSPPDRSRASMEAALRSVDQLPALEAGLVRAWADHVEGRDDAALRRYDELLSRFPDSPEVLREAGTLQWFRGQYAAAVPYWQRALGVDPSDEMVRAALLEAFGMLGRRADLERLVEETSRLPPNSSRTRTLVNGLLRLGRPADAVAAARERLRDDPSDDARAGLQAALDATGQFEEEERLVRQALREGRLARASLPDAVASQGRFREAERLLDEEARGQERPVAGREAYIRASWLGDGRDLAALWREASKVRAVDPVLASDLAVPLALRGALAHAAELAAGLPPASPAAEQVAALLQWRRGDAVGAQARLAALEAREAEPIEGIYPSFLIAEIAVASGDPREALSALSRWRRQPVKGYWHAWAWPRALLLEARAHLALGERDAARAALDRLLLLYRRADEGLPLLREARALRAQP